MFPGEVEESLKTPEGNQLKVFGGYFAESDNVKTAQYFGESAMNHTVEHGYLFDVPEEIKGDLQEEGINVYKQRKSPMMNMQAQKRDQLLKRISLVEKRLKQLEAQKKRPISMIGAGLLHDDFVQVANDTKDAAFMLDYALHYSDEGKNLQSAFDIWADSPSGKDVLTKAHEFPSDPQGKLIFDELESAHNVVAAHGSLDETEDPHSHYAYLDNEHLAQIGHHAEQVGHHVDNL